MLLLTRNERDAIVIPSFDVTVTVQSVKGNHSRLGISLPDGITVHREEVRAHVNSQPQAALDDLSMEGVRILFADADPVLAEHYQAHLSRLGFEVTTAADGLACIAQIRQRTPHLVVLDAGLLWGRAEGVLALMQEHSDIPDVPVLVTYDADGPAVRLFGAGDYLAKPFNLQELAMRIRKLIAFPVGDCDSQR